MENQVENRTHEIAEIRDLYFKEKFELTQLRFQSEKASRSLRIATASTDRLQDQLKQAFAIIARREAEIKELRDLLHDISVRTAPISVQSKIHEISEDESNVTAMKEYRRRVAVTELQPPSRIVSGPPVSTGLQLLLARQTRSIEIWHARRNLILRQQREQMLSILTGMRLVVPEILHEPPKPARVWAPLIQIPPDRHMPQQTIVQTRLLIPPGWKARFRERAALGRTIPKANDGYEEYDKGVTRASTPNPELPVKLEDGVIGVPL
jgi:hypothetical protein